jgi:hypothetical protein
MRWRRTRGSVTSTAAGPSTTRRPSTSTPSASTPATSPSRTAGGATSSSTHAKLLPERSSFQLVWLLDGRPVGFSTADKIQFGEQANMHLHIVEPDRRRPGMGVQFVRMSAQLYFDPPAPAALLPAQRPQHRAQPHRAGRRLPLRQDPHDRPLTPSTTANP